jgi:hypothetical protein
VVPSSCLTHLGDLIIFYEVILLIAHVASVAASLARLDKNPVHKKYSEHSTLFFMLCLESVPEHNISTHTFYTSEITGFAISRNTPKHFGVLRH